MRAGRAHSRGVESDLRLVDTKSYVSAILNILEDSAQEKARLSDTQYAVLNILDDAAGEETRLKAAQKAILNVLDDSAEEKTRLADTQRAAINILEDFDIEKKKVEQVNVALRNEVAERARAEETIKQYADKLERSNTDLAHFAYAASHDLREPLRMVSSFMALVRESCREKLNPEEAQYIAFAEDGALRMQAMIDALLTYSKVGRDDRPMEPLESGDLVNEAISNLGVAIQEASAQIEVGNLPRITGNKIELVCVFQNLLANAIKFRKEKPPAVAVSAERKGNQWRFTVRDRGIGIDPRYFDRIFKMFQRLHGVGEYTGTGLGLALVKKIVDRHGGNVSVESEPGRGSAFHFTLPV